MWPYATKKKRNARGVVVASRVPVRSVTVCQTQRGLTVNWPKSAGDIPHNLTPLYRIRITPKGVHA